MRHMGVTAHMPYFVRNMAYGVWIIQLTALRPVAAAQVDEIAAAIESPRRRSRGRALISALGLFGAVADRFDAARIDSQAGQEVADRASATVAETQVVLRCAARVAVAFDAEEYRAIALQVEKFGQGAQLILLRLEKIGFVKVEKDRLGHGAELIGGRRLFNRLWLFLFHRRRRRFGNGDASAGAGGTAVAHGRRGIGSRGARTDFTLAGTRHFAESGDGHDLRVFRGPAQSSVLAEIERRFISR